MTDYYSKNLSAKRLEQCYEIAPPRIEQYLKAEMSFALAHIFPADSVIDLGCGYGRTLASIASLAKELTGLDSSLDNLIMARQFLSNSKNIQLTCADAGQLPFPDHSFDLVTCLQNGISAFKIAPRALLKEAIRVTKPGGRLLFSTYSENIWPDRLNWFELQAEAGLLGEIDYDKTGNGEIVCQDGFTATTFTEDDFLELTDEIEAEVFITEVDRSSLFCIIEMV